MTKGLFITAIDTDCGKTAITGAIAAALNARGIRAGAFKPLASGGVEDEHGTLVSEDARFLARAASIPDAQVWKVNEICLRPALTPAAAAKLCGERIDMERIAARMMEHAAEYEVALIEGVGGIMAPLWEEYLVADFMRRLGLPSILVSHLRLGSINFTALTHAYAKSRGIALGGVIYNFYDSETACVLEASNADYIRRLTGMPELGRMPPLRDKGIDAMRPEELAEAAEAYLDIDAILKLIG